LFHSEILWTKTSKLSEVEDAAMANIHTRRYSDRPR